MAGWSGPWGEYARGANWSSLASPERVPPPVGWAKLVSAGLDVLPSAATDTRLVSVFVRSRGGHAHLANVSVLHALSHNNLLALWGSAMRSAEVCVARRAPVAPLARPRPFA